MSEKVWIRGCIPLGENAHNVAVGRKLCDALGLKNVLSLVISANVSGFATVTVEQYLTAQQESDLATVLREFELVAVTRDESVSAGSDRSGTQHHPV